jgi:hypothetical protein
MFLTRGPILALLVALSCIAPVANDVAAASEPLAWRWSNPQPHGADIFDFAWHTNGLAVQAGERGQLYTSTDFAAWIPRETHTQRALRGITFLGPRLVVCGESGTILYADDPAAITTLDLGTVDWFEAVAASADRLVAVGDNGAVYTSTNAVQWQRRSVPFNTWLRSVAWGTPGFVAVGENGFIATSPDASAWTVRSGVTSAHLNRVAWLNDRYWALGDGGVVLASTTGVSWQNQNAGATNALAAVAGSSTVNLIAGEREVRTRQGGTWTDQLGPEKPWPPPMWTYYSGLWDGQAFWIGGASGLTAQGYATNASSALEWGAPSDGVLRSWLWAVARTPICYLAVGERGTIMASDNGIDWDLDLVPPTATNTVLLGVGGDTRRMLAVGSGGTILHSTNTVTWEALGSSTTTNDLQAVAVLGDLFVVAGANGTLLTSSNATTWARRTVPTTQFLSGLAAFSGGLIAVGDAGTILSSQNGVDWTPRSRATTNWLWQVRWLNGRLVVIGENGTLLTSADGVTWTQPQTGTTEWLTDAAFLDSTWWVTGTYGTVLSSTDLVHWTPRGAATRKPLFGAASAGGQLLAVGAEGVILRCQIVPDPTPIQILEYAHVAGYDLFLFGGMPDQRFEIQVSPDLAGWQALTPLEFLDGNGTLIHTSIRPAAGPTQCYRAVSRP